MSKEVLHFRKMPFRLLFISQVAIGLILLTLFIFFLIDGFYLDYWTFAGPLLGLAMLITGLTGSKIKEINYNSTNLQLTIKKESLFNTTERIIEFHELDIEMKDTTGTGFIQKLKLVILENDNTIEKIESGLLSTNNSSIKKIYYRLKDLIAGK